MDIPILPSDYAPKPREEVRIEEVEIAVYPDRRRVFVHLRVTPFLERPNLLLTMRGESDQIVSELNVIETMHNDMEFTMHLRGMQGDPAGLYTLEVELFFESRNPPHDSRVEAFEIPTADAQEDAP